MLVPDEVRKCVAFVCARFNDGLRPCGTAFLFATPIPETERMWVDVVTAKHILAGIRTHSMDGKVLLRFNLKSGGYTLVETDVAQWVLHPTGSVDVGIVALSIPPDLDFRFLAESIAVTPDIIAKHRIGIGDDVFITGLFANHYGTEQNIPILRVGNIAAVPEEPVKTQLGAMEAYLVEARSIGGLSGSPVFVYLDPLRQGAGPKGSLLVSSGDGPIGGAFFLLGLIHGHYDVPAVLDLERADGLRDKAINMGIAIVVPVTKIIETINQPERAALRKYAYNNLKKENY